MSEFPPNWQIARERFNHDWLKNQYLPALESFHNILKGQVQRVNSDQEFWEIDLPQWEEHRAEADNLIRYFEDYMSPRILLEEVPLCGLDMRAKGWVGEVVHSLWVSRLSIPDMKRNAAACLKTADAAYTKLKANIAANPNVVMDSILMQSFDEFRNACHSLARAFERFPSRVRVV